MFYLFQEKALSPLFIYLFIFQRGPFRPRLLLKMDRDVDIWSINLTDPENVTALHSS